MKALLTFCILLCLLTTTQAATRYLNAAAAGANNGTTEADGWTSVGSLSAGVASGDTLIVSPGTYDGALSFTDKANLTVQIKAGSTTAAIFTSSHLYNCDNIIVDGYEGGLKLFKITNKSSSLGHAINLRRSVPALIQGMEVDRADNYGTDTAQQHAMRIWDYSGDVTVEYCYFHHTTGDGINVSQVTSPTSGRELDWMTFSNNTITHVGDDGIQYAASYGLIEGCTIDNGGFATYFGGHPDGIQLNPDQRSLTVRNNTIKGFNQNIFIEYANGDIFLYNNILIGTRTNAADRALNYSARTWSGKWVWANNTIYNFLCYQAMNGAMSGSVAPEDYTVKNNVFINCKVLTAYETSLIGADTFYYDLPGVQYYDTSGGAVSVPADRKAGSATNSDPLLVNPASGDFTVGAGSPLIGAGYNASAFFTTDYAGTARSLPYDSGAYEYGTAGTNAAPVVTVTSPADGTTSEVAAVTFTGTATDAEDGTLSSGITWTSNLDGALGTGASVTPTLSSGTHTITASRTDSGSLTSTSSILITVNPPSATFNVETLSVSRIRVVP